jgi:hypothetical protein
MFVSRKSQRRTISKMTVARLRKARAALLASLTVVTLGAPTLATAQLLPKRPAERCKVENTQRNRSGTKQVCLPNAKGILRWVAAPTPLPQAAPKVLAAFGDGEGTNIQIAAPMPDGSMLVGGGFWYEAQVGNFALSRVSQPYTGFLARISPDFEWSSATQFGGRGPGFEFTNIVPLRDNSAIVTGAFREVITIGSQTHRAYTTKRSKVVGVGPSDCNWSVKTAFVGNLLPDGSWGWSHALTYKSYSQITSVSELADGSIFISGLFNDIAEHSTSSECFDGQRLGGAESDQHFFGIIGKDGKFRRYGVLPVSAVLPGSWLYPTSIKVLADGSVVVAGNYCGSVSLASTTLPKLGTPITNKNGRVDDLCSEWIPDTSAFVAKLRADLSVEWLTDLQPTGGRKDGNWPNVVVADAILTPNGDIAIVGSLGYGGLRIGSTTLKSRGFYDSGNKRLWEKLGFVALLNSAGAWKWGTQVGRDIQRIEPSPDSSFVVLGRYSGPSLVVGSSRLTSRNETDAFVAKFNASGRGTWALGVTAPNADRNDGVNYFSDIEVLNDGTVVLAAQASGGGARIGGTELGGRSYTSRGFVTRISPSGVWK